MAVPDFSASVRPDVQGDRAELMWRRSSYSNYQGNCVELAWRKSSRSNGGGACVELPLAVEAVAFRDSKNPDGPILTFPSRSLTAFLTRC